MTAECIDYMMTRQWGDSVAENQSYDDMPLSADALAAAAAYDATLAWSIKAVYYSNDMASLTNAEYFSTPTTQFLVPEHFSSMRQMNLSSTHCKLLQCVWRDLRAQKLKQQKRALSKKLLTDEMKRNRQKPERFGSMSSGTAAQKDSKQLMRSDNDDVIEFKPHDFGVSAENSDVHNELCTATTDILLRKIIFDFVDCAIWKLRSQKFRAQFFDHCRRFGRHVAAVFRGTLVSSVQQNPGNKKADASAQCMSWEQLGKSIIDSFPATLSPIELLRKRRSTKINNDLQHYYNNNANKKIKSFKSSTFYGLRTRSQTESLLWQLFVDNLSTIVFESFCWSVSKDFTTTPLATILEVSGDATRCFAHKFGAATTVAAVAGSSFSKNGHDYSVRRMANVLRDPLRRNGSNNALTHNNDTVVGDEDVLVTDGVIGDCNVEGTSHNASPRATIFRRFFAKFVNFHRLSSTTCI